MPNVIIIAPGGDLLQHEEVAAVIDDIAMLPKAIGGAAVSVDEETGEEDVHCSRGASHPRLSAFLESLESSEIASMKPTGWYSDSVQ